MTIRYSVSATAGVKETSVNTRVAKSIRELYDQYRRPVTLPVEAADYCAMDKRARSAVKLRLPYFIGGEVEGTRDDKHVAARTLLTLDIERKPKQTASPPDPAVVVRRLREAGASGWVYTSLSHTREEPRYRVVLPLVTPIRRGAIAAATLRQATLAAATTLGVDTWCASESWVLSQPMFLPARLRGAVFKQWVVEGDGWTAASTDTAGSTVADIPDRVESTDPVIAALRAAGLYLRADEERAGRHYFTCPWSDQHTTSNSTQTVYFEAHHGGYKAWGCKCLGTGPDVDGRPHMTRASLTAWLVSSGHLRDGDEVGELDEYEEFDKKTSFERLLSVPPPPQLWAVRDFAPIGAVTLLAAPGGQGKSLLMTHLIAHGALGVGWAGFRFDADGLRTLYVSYEDGPRQIYDRVVEIKGDLEARHGLLYDVEAALRDRLLVHRVDDPGTWLFLSKPDRFSPAERTARVDWLIGYLRHRQVGMVVFDPMVYTHQLEENSVSDMAYYMQTLGHIAREAGVAVVVVHHMSKMGRGESLVEIDAHSLRGASSITDNARSVAVFVGLPFKDAVGYGVTESDAAGLVVFKHVKSNYGPLLPLVVFGRQGRLLVQRPDVARLDLAAQKVVREQQAEVVRDKSMEVYALQALEVLVEHSGGISQNQVALGVPVRWSPQRAKRVLAWCEDRELTTSDWGAGGGRAGSHRVTAEGRRFLLKHRTTARTARDC